ncbi:MAG: thiol-disulfide oxidoreductase DCC family protein [Anaerolineales bacterium]|nr:thiol-disulfide oxidoreductase DCC family protein [Anaerolineales bacterium]MCB8962948.1 thiol-disulfide oxidoreductase DCC family protein [Ardenticatenales bacterium]
MGNPAAADGPILLFDGVCNLCQGSVQFIIKRDKAALFRFASLQSEFGRAAIARHGRDPDRLDSFILLENDRLFDRSTAALKVARQLPFPWWLATAGLVVPRPLRDWVYDQIAKRRYRWFGRQDECWLPTPELRQRFLDQA